MRPFLQVSAALLRCRLFFPASPVTLNPNSSCLQEKIVFMKRYLIPFWFWTSCFWPEAPFGFAQVPFHRPRAPHRSNLQGQGPSPSTNPKTVQTMTAPSPVRIYLRIRLPLLKLHRQIPLLPTNVPPLPQSLPLNLNRIPLQKPNLLPRRSRSLPRQRNRFRTIKPQFPWKIFPPWHRIFSLI